jgi:hypothetical protein
MRLPADNHRFSKTATQERVAVPGTLTHPE